MSDSSKTASGKQLEEEIAREIIHFLKDHVGRGPEGYRTYLADDMFIIRLHKIFSPAEHEMAKTESGRQSVKETRRRLIEELRPLLEEMVRTATGAEVVSLHSDVSTKTGEGLIIFVLNRKLGTKERSGGGDFVDVGGGNQDEP